MDAAQTVQDGEDGMSSWANSSEGPVRISYDPLAMSWVSLRNWDIHDRPEMADIVHVVFLPSGICTIA